MRARRARRGDRFPQGRGEGGSPGDVLLGDSGAGGYRRARRRYRPDGRTGHAVGGGAAWAGRGGALRARNGGEQGARSLRWRRTEERSQRRFRYRRPAEVSLEDSLGDSPSGGELSRTAGVGGPPEGPGAGPDPARDPAQRAIGERLSEP